MTPTQDPTDPTEPSRARQFWTNHGEKIKGTLAVAGAGAGRTVA